MNLIDLTCTKCGATMKVNQKLEKCFCNYCGNEIVVDKEIIGHRK